MTDAFVPNVSVVIPAYNCAEFLPAAIESVLAQTYSDLEIIVIDDGSTDETLSAVTRYLDRIHFLRQPNKGLPGARNTGIRAARAPFIALLDADDTWLPEKLELQMPRFTDPAVGIVYSDFSVRYADGRQQASYLVNRPLAAEGYVFEPYIQSRFLFPSTMVLRRELVEACGLFDEQMLACEDIELFARILLRCKVARIDRALMVRYEGAHNITANSAKLNRYTILALRKVLAKEPRLPKSARGVVYRELGRQYLWAGYADFQHGRMSEARRHLVRSMRYDARQTRACLPLLAASFLPQPMLKRLREVNSRRAKRA